MLPRSPGHPVIGEQSRFLQSLGTGNDADNTGSTESMTTTRQRPLPTYGATTTTTTRAAEAATATAENSPGSSSSSPNGLRTVAMQHEQQPQDEQEPDAVVRIQYEYDQGDSTTPAVAAAVGGGGDEDDLNGPVAILTRRLRCLFGIITWPIVPLGTLAMLALLWFFYSFVLDFNRDCSHPLKAYALATLFWVAYIPSHTTARSRLFSYERERDGPNRPPLVRRYDQIFHTLALLYVYAGITLVQSCRDDEHSQLLSLQEQQQQQQQTSSMEDEAGIAAAAIGMNITDVTALGLENTSHGGMPDLSNTCAATCPNLFPALAVYVTTLEVFTLSLILPLLFLPCIYLWFLRQVTADRDLAILQERFREEEEALLSGQAAVTAEDIFAQLETVQLFRKRPQQQQQQQQRPGGFNSSDPKWNDADGDDEIYVVPITSNAAGMTTSTMTSESSQSKERQPLVRDCCICMSDFVIHDEKAQELQNRDVESGGGVVADLNSENDDDEAVVRIPVCGHLFHRRCLASWVGGNDWLHHGGGTTGGRSSSSNNNNGSANAEGHDFPWRRHRAKRSSCPLCRSDLRPPN